MFCVPKHTFDNLFKKLASEICNSNGSGVKLSPGARRVAHYAFEEFAGSPFSDSAVLTGGYKLFFCAMPFYAASSLWHKYI